MDDTDRAWLIEHLRQVAKENLEDDLDQLFSRLDSDGDGKVAGRTAGGERVAPWEGNYRWRGGERVAP